MSGHTTAPDLLWSIVLAESKGSVPILLFCALLTAACAKPAVHRAIPTDSLLPSMACQAGDCHVLADKWEFVDGAAVQLTLDEQGNGHYDWRDGRFETRGPSIIPGRACGFRRRMTERVDLQSSFRPIFQKRRDAGGSAASEPTMHPRKRAERFISPRRPLYEPKRYFTGTVSGFSRHGRDKTGRL